MVFSRTLKLVLIGMSVVGCAQTANKPQENRATTHPIAQHLAPTTASNSAEYTASLIKIMDAIARGDDAQVADAVLLPVKLSPHEQLLYARRLILGSQLQWLMDERFGTRAARVTMVTGGLEYIPHVDPPALTWEQMGPPLRGPLVAAGGIESVVGHSPDDRFEIVSMARTNDGYKLDRTHEIAALVLLNVEDAPWRNAVVSHVVDDVKSGKLSDAAAVSDALQLHAPASHPSTVPADRSSPEGALFVLWDAVERGDEALIVDSFYFLREGDGGAARRHLAGRLVADHALAKALLAKFGAEQGRRLIQECGLTYAHGSLDMHRRARWVVEDDVARAVMPYGRYDVAVRMVRASGAWRIEWVAENIGWQPDKTDDDKERDRWEQSRPQREMDVLKHLDRYPSPRSILTALSENYARQKQPDQEISAKEMDRRIAEARRQIATHPATSTRQAFEYEFGISMLQFSAAALRGDAKSASKYYFADGDDGAYALARVRRRLAIDELYEAVGKEIGGDAFQARYGLTDVADDLYGLAMLNWEVQGDRARGWLNEQHDGTVPEASLRKQDGMWKIDVSDETNGDPKSAATRAQEETRKLQQLTEDVKRLNFKNAEEFKKALQESGVKGAGRPQ